MNGSEIMQDEQTLMPNVYAKRPPMLVRGKEALVWDDEDRQFIDCTRSYGSRFSGIAIQQSSRP
jgi:acetylornithine/succinyldiaminopimelate/putrescine aminotransferase